MTTHVFVVDTNTFKYHLGYLFAGTGAGDAVVDFNNKPDSDLHHSKENILVDMIADWSRIRQGDLIIFYVQQSLSEGFKEGKFYGVFKAKNNWSFLDNNDDQQYLREELGKSLTFRTLIEPHKVYPEGVTEWEALDEIKNISSPNQMLWSLIYRKLKAKRGNTMITKYESERLLQLIKNKNGGNILSLDGNGVSFDLPSERIVVMDEGTKEYKGRQEAINILPRLIAKMSTGNVAESHLQAYVTQFIGLGMNNSLDQSLLIDDYEIEWLGNEVYCGVGMRKIDVMLSLHRDNEREVVPVELKATQATEVNVAQIQRYVDWIQQYYIPNMPSSIQPVLLAKRFEDKDSDIYQRVVESFRRFNESNAGATSNLKYIEFDIDDADLVFVEVDYHPDQTEE